MIKKSKKIVAMPLLAAMILTPFGVQAAEKAERISSIAETGIKQEADYICFKGKITEVVYNENNPYIVVENEASSGYGTARFYISDGALLVNKDSKSFIKGEEFKEGMSVDVYYSKNTIMTMIYPPQINPSVIMISDDENRGMVTVSKFNEKMISADRMLKLNISDETEIVNGNGDKVKKEELLNKDLVVFYDFLTKSIPAQTTPKKIIVLDKENNNSNEVNSTFSVFKALENIFGK